VAGQHPASAAAQAASLDPEGDAAKAKAHREAGVLNDLTRVYRGMKHVVTRDGPRQQQESELRFAVGVNSAVDLIVSGTELMAALEVLPGATKLHESMASVQDLGELLDCFSPVLLWCFVMSC
jgi:hypothetical protein